MILYYQETETGDYLCIETKSIYPLHTAYEGRAVCIARNINSVNTTSISKGYLKKNCRRVAKKDVPKEWLNVL